VNTGKFEIFKETVSIENIDHDPARGQVPGPEGHRAFFERLRIAFPDLRVALETLVADEESIAIAYTLTGTQNGPLMRIAPTGRSMKIRGIQIPKFSDGRMVERWGGSDELGMLQQLGSVAGSCS
jgi:predicted ester cyclase